LQKLIGFLLLITPITDLQSAVILTLGVLDIDWSYGVLQSVKVC